MGSQRLGAQSLVEPGALIRQGILGVLIVSCCSFFLACSPGYVVRAAYEQSKVLLKRRPIVEVINDPQVSADDRQKMRMVLEVREFAENIGLKPGDSFTYYADIGKDTLAWVVMASRKDSFDMYTWWFPIVGTVPYKGFFDKQDAIEQAHELQANGFESSIRGTEAFSTLGWFNDPLLSTTLKGAPERIANTILHESVHPTVWISGHVAFNESLANFVGARAAIDFFRARQNSVDQEPLLGESWATRVKYAENMYRSTMEFGDCVSVVYEALGGLYARSDRTSAQKVAERQGVFENAIQSLRAQGVLCPSLTALNNADLLQSVIYTQKLRVFEELFERGGSSWTSFFDRIMDLQRQLGTEEEGDPFVVLKTIVAQPG